jgi:outer membrane protein TolC
MGWTAGDLSRLFTRNAFSGSVGPAFQWNILNYGRIRNGVRFEEARFQELAANYQNGVLRANAEVESALVRFLRAQEAAKLLDRSVANAQKAAGIVSRKYKEGQVDFNRVALIELTLVQQQDLQTQAHGEIAQGLIQVYRAMGGGWEAPIPQRSPEEIPLASPDESSTPDESIAPDELAPTAPFPKSRPASEVLRLLRDRLGGG